MSPINKEKISQTELASVGEDIFERVCAEHDDFLFEKDRDCLYESMTELVAEGCSPEFIEKKIRKEASERREHFQDKRKIFQKYKDVYNKEHFKNIVLRELQRGNENLCYMFFDADGLKAINDLVGYDKGDKYLGVIMDAIQDAIKEVQKELFLRYGGKADEIKFFISAQGGDEFGLFIVGSKEGADFDSHIDLTDYVGTQRVDEIVSSKITARLRECNLEEQGIISRDDFIARFKSLQAKEFNRLSLVVANEDILSDDKKWQEILRYINKNKGIDAAVNLRFMSLLASYDELKRLKAFPDSKDSQALLSDEIHDFKDLLIYFLHDITEAREKELMSATTGFKFVPSTSYGVRHFPEKYIDHIVDKDKIDYDGQTRTFEEKKEAYLREKKEEFLTSYLKNRGSIMPSFDLGNLSEIIARYSDWDLINKQGGISDAELSIIVSDTLKDGEANAILDDIIINYVYDSHFRNLLVEKSKSLGSGIGREEIIRMYFEGDNLSDDEKAVFNPILQEAKRAIFLDSCDHAMKRHKNKVRAKMREEAVNYDQYAQAKSRFIDAVREYSKSKDMGDGAKIAASREAKEKAKMEFRRARKGYHTMLTLYVLSRNDEMMAMEERNAELAEENKRLEQEIKNLTEEMKELEERLEDSGRKFRF